jgi:hypothetical protein
MILFILYKCSLIVSLICESYNDHMHAEGTLLTSIILPPSQLHLLGTCVSLPVFSAETGARENPEKKILSMCPLTQFVIFTYDFPLMV